MKSFLGVFQRLLAKNKLFVFTLVYIRNQINIIIGNHITGSINFNINGEKKIMEYFLPNSSIILDIGANIGQYSEKILSILGEKDYKLYVFEPSIKCFKELQEKFTSSKIIFYNYAISNFSGEKDFHEINDTGENSSLIFANAKGNYKRYKVEVKQLDELFPEGNNIDFIKIDTEGNDFNVLLGAKQLLKDKRIRAIQFEYNDSWRYAGHTIIDAINFLNETDYLTYLIRPDGIYEFDYQFWGEYYHYSNFLTTTKDNYPNIKQLIKGKF
ncbi:MAG TPA: FkbM family methyltransferase [Bacteroidales bacterium]